MFMYFISFLLPIRISFYWFLWTAFHNLSMISFDFELLIRNRKYSKFSSKNTLLKEVRQCYHNFNSRCIDFDLWMHASLNSRHSNYLFKKIGRHLLFVNDRNPLKIYIVEFSFLISMQEKFHLWRYSRHSEHWNYETLIAAPSFAVRDLFNCFQVTFDLMTSTIVFHLSINKY